MRSIASCWPLLNRRAALANEVGELKRAKARRVPPRARGAGDQRPAGSQPRAAEGRQRRAPSGARSCRPAGRSRRRSAWPSSAPPAPSASRPRSSSSAPASSTCPASASTRCSTPRPPAPRSTAWCRWRTPPRAWSRARSTCSCTRPLHVVGEISLLVRHHLLRTVQLARRHRGGAGPSAGAGAVPGLAEQAPAGRRAARRLQQRRRRPAGGHQPGLGRHRQRTRRHRVRPAHRRPCDPGRRLQPHPLRRDLPAADAGERRRPRARTASAWWSRCPTGPARCTTSWCRSSSTTSR